MRRLREVVAGAEVELRIAGPIVGDTELEQHRGIAGAGRSIELEHGDVAVVLEAAADLERNGICRVARGGAARGRGGRPATASLGAGVVVAGDLALCAEPTAGAAQSEAATTRIANRLSHWVVDVPPRASD